MVHSLLQKIGMLSTGEQTLDEMACLKNLPCGTLNTRKQFVSFQVSPVALPYRESNKRKIGRGVLQRCSCQDSSYAEHQIELENICLLSQTGLDTGHKSKKMIAESMDEGIASLENKPVYIITSLLAAYLQNIGFYIGSFNPKNRNRYFYRVFTKYKG